jgi:hypothetical protein
VHFDVIFIYFYIHRYYFYILNWNKSYKVYQKYKSIIVTFHHCLFTSFRPDLHLLCVLFFWIGRTRMWIYAIKNFFSLAMNLRRSTGELKVEGRSLPVWYFTERQPRRRRKRGNLDFPIIWNVWWCQTVIFLYLGGAPPKTNQCLGTVSPRPFF